ncbi:hypothetical protein [Legionella sp. km772]|uniref:hypothetical protein n=1 Tax=Legionella sp. km772 TaxID=2498111 RepID=UPI000F8E1F7C|nr:hypothetical protein [Legionella sp. km772]RUR13137.1 hypothetical protein ELY15_03285 [Legionella sp. km772]
MKGLAEGVAEGKGLSTIASAVKGAIFGGFSGLASGFNKSLEKDLAAKRESSDIVLSSPSSMQKGQPPTITSTGPQTSMNAERSKEETEDHDDDYERGAHPV